MGGEHRRQIPAGFVLMIQIKAHAGQPQRLFRRTGIQPGQRQTAAPFQIALALLLQPGQPLHRLLPGLVLRRAQVQPGHQQRQLQVRAHLLPADQPQIDGSLHLILHQIQRVVPAAPGRQFLGTGPGLFVQQPCHPLFRSPSLFPASKFLYQSGPGVFPGPRLCSKAQLEAFALHGHTGAAAHLHRHAVPGGQHLALGQLQVPCQQVHDQVCQQVPQLHRAAGAV